MKINTESKYSTIQMQKLLVVVSVVLFMVKLTAWLMTDSVAILTDTLESTVNVIAGFLGLYSIILSSKPKDKEHPYGHGKVEFITSAIEGIFISMAGVLIIYEAINNLFQPHDIKKLDFGMLLIAFTAVVNYGVGQLCVKKGIKENSPLLTASGSHLKSDTYSSLGLLIGIALLWITGYKWIDSAAALIFAIFIIYTGYKIIRRGISGIMDEKDSQIIDDIVHLLNTNRHAEWIDVHNMRVIDYAGFYHIDCHLTVPYYINVNEAHVILDKLTQLFQTHFNQKVEFFIHVDGCIPSQQCSICNVANCHVREKEFTSCITWTHDNLLSNQKHTEQNEK